MPDRLVLHAGMHKTGTTAVQEALARQGGGPGWEYLRFVHPNSSHVLMQAFADRPRPDNGLPQPSFAAGPEEARQLVAARMRAVGAPLVVLSGEALSNFPAGALPRLLAACRQHLRDLRRIECVAYIRAPLSFAHANFQQRLQTKLVPFDRIVLPRLMDYAGRFKALERELGRGNVGYRPYLRDRFPDRSVVRDIASWLEIDPPPAEAAPGGVNTSLSGDAVRLLYLWRKRHPEIRPGDGRLIGALATLPGAPLRLSGSVLATALAALDPQRAWAEDRMGWDMAEAPVKDDAGAIRSEADFERLGQDSLNWLGGRSGIPASRLAGGPDALVEALARLAAPTVRSRAGDALRAIRGRS